MNFKEVLNNEIVFFFILCVCESICWNDCFRWQTVILEATLFKFCFPPLPWWFVHQAFQWSASREPDLHWPTSRELWGDICGDHNTGFWRRCRHVHAPWHHSYRKLVGIHGKHTGHTVLSPVCNRNVKLKQKFIIYNLLYVPSFVFLCKGLFLFCFWLLILLKKYFGGLFFMFPFCISK